MIIHSHPTVRTQATRQKFFPLLLLVLRHSLRFRRASDGLGSVLALFTYEEGSISMRLPLSYHI